MPRVQVVPVLACSGQGAALVLHCSQPAGETAAPGQDVSALLQPVCLWCTLPLVARLQAFGAGVTEHLWPAAAAGEEASAGVAVEDAADGLDRQQQGQGQGQGQMQSEAVESSSKAAVSAAISDILQRQQQPGKARYGQCCHAIFLPGKGAAVLCPRTFVLAAGFAALRCPLPQLLRCTSFDPSHLSFSPMQNTGQPVC